MAIHRTRQMSVEEYFDFEETSEIRHEYIDGELYPMTGGTFHHSIIKVNLTGELRYLLKESDCQVANSDMRIHISPTRYFYPDLSVVRGEPELDERAINLFNPTLVAEVTSPATAADDRGFKRGLYQSIASLQVYLIIDQFKAQVEVDSRQGDHWHTQEYAGLDAIIPLPTLNCELPLAEIYAGISF